MDTWTSPCADCGIDTLPFDEGRAEFYVVTDEVWAAAGMPDDNDDGGGGGGFLCIGCLEARLGRRLTASDFTDCPMNDLSISDTMRYAWSWRTPRLVARLSDTGPS